MIPVGSAGDVHPHVGLGVALRARGHDVSVLTNPYFRATVEHAGLRLIPWGTVEQYDAVTRHPRLWHTTRGIETIARSLSHAMPEMYRLLEAESRHGNLLVVAHGLAFGARLAYDTLGVPLVTLHLQPSSFYSVHDAPVLHPWLWSINELPVDIKRVLFKIIDRAADRAFGPAVNELVAAQGVSPVRHITSRWWHSPHRVIGLFPDWLAAPQVDWPPHSALTGFPLFDDDHGDRLRPDVERFVDAGSPPIVFLPGSSNRQASRFFRAAVEACLVLKRRGILLTKYGEQVPQPLPDDVRWFDYVPLGRLLPRVAALVHHGGIGTAAQGLAHAVPHAIMPMTFDQPDNARRLVDLGVARTIWPRSFHGLQLAATLDELLDAPSVSARCEELAARIGRDDPVQRTCELIEQAA